MRVLLFLLAVPLVARADIDPGNWELQVSTQIQGAPEPVSLDTTRCLTAEDARDPSRVFGGTPGGGCEFTNRQDTGSLFTFDVVCGAGQPIRGSGRVRYARDSLDGELELNADNFAARSHITGRRLGGC
jgi:hypothetical protein